MKLSNINLNPKTLEYRNGLITLNEVQNLSTMVHNFSSAVQVVQKYISREQRFASAKAHSDLGSVWMSNESNPARDAVYAFNNPEGLRGVEQLTALIARRHIYYQPRYVDDMPQLGVLSVGFMYKGSSIAYQKQVPVRMQNMMHAITDFLSTDEVIQGKAQLSGVMLDITWRNTRGYYSGLGYGFDVKVVPTPGGHKTLSSNQGEAAVAFHRHIQLLVQRKLRLAIEKLRLHMDPTLYKRPMRIKGEDE